MKQIGILSDTHSFWDDKYAQYFASCDEIWHAGDIGSMEVATRLSSLIPLRAVYGNRDSGYIRLHFPAILRFRCEDADVLLTHIGGYPGNYDPRIRKNITASPPDLFVCGHSHILKVQYDKTLHLLHINPGAAGTMGWHRERTIIRLTVCGKEFKDLEVVTIGKNDTLL